MSNPKVSEGSQKIKSASELEKLEPEKISVPVEKSVNEFFYPPL